MKKKSSRRYNWRPDLPDHRDFIFSERIERRTALPAKADLRSRCSPVFDQGKIGSCTGNALAGALEFLEKRELSDAVRGRGEPEVFTPGEFARFSRLFIYYNERAIEGTTSQDGGAQLRDGVKSLNKWGACRESVWKYGPAQVLKKPTAKAYSEAEDHRITEYLRIEDLAGVRQSLSDGFPVAFGFAVYESFESPDVARTGVMPIPSGDERMLGGHAVLAVGYDDAKEMLIVRNSWGEKWGAKGYFFMPYAVVDELRLARDFWTIRG